MPKVTRAFSSQKPAQLPAAATTWAAPCSSHSGGTDNSSPDSGQEHTKSGRERRRDGKAKMLAQIQSLREQLAHLTEDRPLPREDEFRQQVAHLKMKLSFSVHRQAALTAACDAACATCWKFGASPALTHALGTAISSAIHHLASSDAYTLLVPPGPTHAGGPTSGPEVYDIFEAEDKIWTTPSADAAAGDTLDAQCGPLPEQPVYQAWSGKGMATAECLHTTSTRLRNTITDSRDEDCKTHESRVTGQRQALDDVNPEHRCSSENGLLVDFNSQNLAEQCGPSHASPPTVLFDASSSKDLAVQHGPLPQSPSMHLGVKVDTHVSQVSGQRQALDSVVTEHLSSSGEACHVDLNSQNLAKQCGPSPHCPPLVLLEATTKDLVEQCGPSHNSSPIALDGDVTEHRSSSGKAYHVDFNSQNLAKQCGPSPHSPLSVLSDANSKDLAQTTRALSEDFISHESQVTEQRQALDGVNSEHRCSSGNAYQGDFNSQNLAGQCGPSPNDPPFVLFDAISKNLADQSQRNYHPHDSRVAGQRQALDDDNTEHRCSSGNAIQGDFNSLHLAKQEPDDDNFRHRASTKASQEASQPCAVDDTRLTLDSIKSYDAAPADDPASRLTLGPSMRELQRHTQQQDFANTASYDVKPCNSSTMLTLGPSPDELNKTFDDFTAQVAPIIATYRRRKKPTNGQVRSAASAIIRIAKKQAITKDMCCRHLQEYSLALLTAATALW